MPPQRQPAPIAKPHLAVLAERRIDFEFIRYSSGGGDEFPRNHLMHELAELIYSCGDQFYGRYVVRVGQLLESFVLPGINWLPHRVPQSGLGFDLGLITDETGRYLPRRYSFLPPEGIVVEQLYELLTGKRSASPKLRIVSDTPAPKLPEVTPMPGVNESLAQGLRKVQDMKFRLQELESEEAALLLELPALEQAAAEAANVDALVEQRLQELLRPST